MQGEDTELKRSSSPSYGDEGMIHGNGGAGGTDPNAKDLDTIQLGKDNEVNLSPSPISPTAFLEEETKETKTPIKRKWKIIYLNYPKQVWFIVLNELCERFSFYGLWEKKNEGSGANRIQNKTKKKNIFLNK